MNLHHHALFAAAPRAALVALTLATAASSWAQTCVQTNTPFQVAYAQQAGTDTVTMDLVTHRYTFKPRVNMTLCSVGYQSPPSPPTSYRIKLLDVTSGPPVVLYNALFNAPVDFPPTPPFTPTYQPVGPIPLVAGRKYQLRRTAVGYANTSQLIGRLLTNQAGQFPIVAPNVSILGSKFYGGGSPNTNQLLPFIDFGTY